LGLLLGDLKRVASAPVIDSTRFMRSQLRGGGGFRTGRAGRLTNE